MSYLAGILVIGGGGGSAFELHGIGNGATLKKICVWVGGWQIKAIKVWLTDGRSEQFGHSYGGYSEFIFNDGEQFTSLSLWGNGAGTRLGGIKFSTNHGRDFFVYMTSWGLKTEYPVDVASGICMGVTGRSGADIDSLGFIFINSVRDAELTDVIYPTIHNVKPNVAVEEMKSMTYHNNSTATQEYRIESSKKIIKKSSWSVSNSIEHTFSLGVKAGIPNVVEVSTGYALKKGNVTTYALDSTEEKNELVSFPVKVPAGKTVSVNITIGRATVDLPYQGTVKITCYNGSVLQYPTSGVYKGLSYTDAKVVVNESTKNVANKLEAEMETIDKIF